MRQTALSPHQGASFSCLEPWGIYLFSSSGRWVCVGRASDKELGELHVKTLRAWLKTEHLKLILELQKMAQDRRIPDDFTEYDSNTFEHAARVYTGSDSATVVEVDDETNTVTVETDQGNVEMEADDHGLARIKGTTGE